MIDISQPIRALSWKQPFASLMIYGKIETRTWPTTYRGLVLICASKQPYSVAQVQNICGDHQFDRVMDAMVALSWHRTLGHAIAVGRLVDCRPMRPKDEDKCYVQCYPDLWCHVYEEVMPIVPFPWLGSRGWKILTNADKTKIELYDHT